MTAMDTHERLILEEENRTLRARITELEEGARTLGQAAIDNYVRSYCRECKTRTDHDEDACCRTCGVDVVWPDDYIKELEADRDEARKLAEKGRDQTRLCECARSHHVPPAGTHCDDCRLSWEPCDGQCERADHPAPCCMCKILTPDKWCAVCKSAIRALRGGESQASDAAPKGSPQIKISKGFGNELTITTAKEDTP